MLRNFLLAVYLTINIFLCLRNPSVLTNNHHSTLQPFLHIIADHVNVITGNDSCLLTQFSKRRPHEK